ncbi:MAG: hypothetical protein JWM57_2179 [Phycisphaerales bacterium]|nr:hypothetical protein [Phycisphaerales bacterium]
MPMLAALPVFVSNHMDWFVSAVIVALGLLVYGLPDLLRSRPSRVWAIGGVCFRDAVRRRVLWITPLAMLGIILVSQFQKPFDEQDAVRLTVKVCLFTTGLVVTIIALVTAATNLPREIDNRVIFTIVTKPVTRLEIVLGKIVGFARVSAVILLVMGLFSLVYLHTQAWWLGRQIDQALASGDTDSTRRVWLEHFQEQGLLQAQQVTRPVLMSQYARPPEDNDGGWLLGSAQDAVVPFEVDAKQLASAADPNAAPGSFGLVFALKIGYEPLRSAATTAPGAAAPLPPNVALQILDPMSGNVALSVEQLGKGANVNLKDPAGNESVLIQIPPDRATQLASMPRFLVQLICPGVDYQYHIKSSSVTLIVPDSQTSAHPISPARPPLLRGSSIRSGQQLSGPARGVQPVAVYAYRNTPVPKSRNGRVPFELNVGLESSGSDTDREVIGTIEVRAFDQKTGKTSPPTVVYPESRRTVFFDLPEEFVKDGTFDLQVRNRANGHTVSLTVSSISMVSGREYFGFNLLKALVVLWLLALLTATVAFWCSTFLSWPIAVVLSTLIILGHWGVSNVDLGSGIGAQVANDFFPSNAPIATVVNTSVEKLSRTLQLGSSVLPDITAFGVTDRIERGTSLTVGDVVAPLEVFVVFGLPLMTLAYVFLRNKEVAP